MNRLLAALRGVRHNLIKVTPEIVADLEWFRKFIRVYNGKSVIPSQEVSKTIYVDSCLVSGGSTDGKHAYWYEYHNELVNMPISQLECINLLNALDSLQQPGDPP